MTKQIGYYKSDWYIMVDLRFHLFGQVGIIHAVNRFLFGGQHQLPPVKAVAAITERLLISVAERQQPGAHPALITLLPLSLQIHLAPVSYTHLDVYKRQIPNEGGKPRPPSLVCGSCLIGFNPRCSETESSPAQPAQSRNLRPSPTDSRCGLSLIHI